MVPLIAAGLLAGGGSLLGSIVNSAANFASQKATNDTSVDLANTAHQREMADLKAAGLNPILAANRGAPMPSLQAPKVDLGVGEAVNTALAMRRQVAETELVEENTRKTHAETNEYLETQMDRLQERRLAINTALNTQNLNKFQQNLLINQAIEIKKKIEALELDNQHSALDLNRAKAESKYFGGIGGKIDPYLKILGASVNTARGLSQLRLDMRR